MPATRSGKIEFLKSYVSKPLVFTGGIAFRLYDTYGFPLDLTELMARENGLTTDTAGFTALMDEQKARARAAQKKEIIEVSQIKSDVATKFLGYDQTAVTVKVQDVLNIKGRTAVILDATACYAEMGGQVGDRGELEGHGQLWRIVDTQKAGNAWLHSSIKVAQASRLCPKISPPKVWNTNSPWMWRAATRFSDTTPRRICCTGRCTKSSARTPCRRVPSSARTS